MDALIKLESKDFIDGEKVGVIELSNQQKYDIYQDLFVGLKYYSLDNEWVKVESILDESDYEIVREQINTLLFTRKKHSWITAKLVD